MTKAVIFDFDGVIADTETVHLNAFRKILAPEGIEISHGDYFSKYLALDDKTFFTALLEENGKRAAAETVSAMTERKSAMTSEMIKNCGLFDGAEDLIRALSGRGFALAIASGALKSEIESVLLRGGLFDLFSFVASADDCEKCKPDPEVFLLALEGLNKNGTAARAEDCVVIEDSPHGIEAALAAGMKCVAVTNSHPRAALERANLVVESAREINAGVIGSF